jgi:23S rRNA (guanine745-N1)-methyltransferase
MHTEISFRCPVCHQPLLYQPRHFRCTQGHHFDQARSGYVNLLLAQHKHSRQPGDAEPMVLARQRFLAQGYYRPLAQALAALTALPGTALLDLGCGEGYYLSELLTHWRAQGLAPAVAAVDIARRAVHELARRRLGVAVAVASARDLPFADQSFETVLSIFAPLYTAEVQRVLAPGGYVCLVGPGPAHLRGLMQALYAEVRPHRGNFEALEQDPAFVRVAQQTLNTEIAVAQADIPDLLAMTPYYWRSSAERQAALAALPVLATPLQFDIRLYQRR